MSQFRKIELKVLAKSGFKVSGQEIPDSIDYRETFRDLLSAPGAQGLTVGAIRERLAQLASLEKAADFWLVTETQHKQLVSELEGHKWGGVTPNIVQFIDDLQNAPVADAELKAVE